MIVVLAHAGTPLNSVAARVKLGETHAFPVRDGDVF
jgi:hypothetical protein